MNISRLLPIVCVHVFLALPAFAASLPAAGSAAPISLCGEAKGEKAEKDKAEQTEGTDKVEKKTDKKDSKEKKDDSKAAA